MGSHSAKKTSKDSINRLEIFNQSRPRLQAIAYRMLGSITDAEDMVQETFIKWQHASLLEIKNPQAYLTTIITRLCIDRLRSARVQREQYVGTWLPEPIVSNNFEPQAIVELADSLAMAFLVMLEKLSPIERAVFLLREIFDYDYAEISTIINKSPTNCRQIVRRA
ncbi:MAG: sigma-70 family RNA polymerase sigma factor, partial [Waterburya sp.]